MDIFREKIKKSYFGLLFLMFLTSIALSLTACKKKPLNKPKEIILFILLDAARADHFSSFGYNRITTPNIDRIAAKGISFKNHYAQSWATVVSLPQIFSGKYFSKGMMEIADILRRYVDYPFLVEKNPPKIIPEYLNSAGYKTILVSAHPWITENSRIAKGFKERVIVKPENGNPYAKADKVINNLIKIINRESEEKLFFYVHLMDTHFPHFANNLNNKFSSQNEEIENDLLIKNGFPVRVPTVYGDESFSLGNYPKKSLQHLIDLYDNDLFFTDKEIGRLYDYIESRNLKDKTLWIITADHGEALGENGMWGHAPFFFKANQHIPLIISGFPLKNQRLEINDFTENVDILPSILDMLNIQFNKRNFDGTSLLSLIDGDKKLERDYRSNIAFFASTMAIGAISDGIFLIKYLNFKKEIFKKRVPYSKEEIEKIIQEQIYSKYEKFLSNPFAIPDIPFLVRFTEDITYSPTDAVISWNPYKVSDNSSHRYIEERYENDDKWYVNLFNISANGKKETPPPVTLHMRVPNSKYKIYVETANALLSDSENKETAFRARAENEKEWKRITQKESPQLNEAFLKTFSSIDKKNSYFLLLGEYSINDQSFDIEIATEKKHWSIILGFLFIPESYKENLPKKKENIKKEKNERIEKLKALGYLQ
ncbi:MAG: hypothetical protein D6734_08670 [Candidatus Schekmanbacteria bacterium]|nr:MAG: hypothetical protein D6734_08670 [Candidatus Schekmanbacteria bacterium]